MRVREEAKETSKVVDQLPNQDLQNRDHREGHGGTCYDT